MHTYLHAQTIVRTDRNSQRVVTLRTVYEQLHGNPEVSVWKSIKFTSRDVGRITFVTTNFIVARRNVLRPHI